MTTPPSLPTVPGLSWSRHKKPQFDTRIASHVSGREVRVPLRIYPLYEFEAVYSGLTSAASGGFAPQLGSQSLQSLMGFFNQMQGQANTFLYSDPDDNTITGQALGNADGATTAFLFARTLGGFAEPVGWVTAVNNVYLNGAPTAAYTFTGPNTLNLNSAPAFGVAVSADFTYAYNCRFLEDQMDFEEFMSTLYRLGSMKFRSVKSWLGG